MVSKKGGVSTTVVAVVLALAVAGTGGFLVGKRAGWKAAELESAVVATVNGEKITKLALYERLAKGYGPDIVERLIDEKLVEQAAEKAGIEVTAKEINAEIKKLQDEVGEEQLNAQLQQFNMTLDDLREGVLFQLRITKILSKDIATDDASLKKFFEENRNKFEGQVHVRHIVVETEEEAKAIKEQLDGGADFATLAKEKSIEEAAKETGGDLGTQGTGKWVPEFESAVFRLKKDEISQPFKTQYGWHVAQVLDITGPTFEAKKDQVKEGYVQSMVDQRWQSWLTELRDNAKITNTLAPKQ